MCAYPFEKEINLYISIDLFNPKLFWTEYFGRKENQYSHCGKICYITFKIVCIPPKLSKEY